MGHVSPEWNSIIERPEVSHIPYHFMHSFHLDFSPSQFVSSFSGQLCVCVRERDLVLLPIMIVHMDEGY